MHLEGFFGAKLQPDFVVQAFSISEILTFKDTVALEMKQ